MDRNSQLGQIFGYLTNQNIPSLDHFRETDICPSVERTARTEQKRSEIIDLLETEESYPQVWCTANQSVILPIKYL